MAAAVVIGSFENAVPLGEDEVARDDDAPSFVPLGEERKEHLHLLAALRNRPVGDVVTRFG